MLVVTFNLEHEGLIVTQGPEKGKLFRANTISAIA